MAREAGHDALLAEALNTAGGLDLVEERFEAAGELFLQALALATDADLRGRIEQNLGTVASALGDYPAGIRRYERSLAGFLAASNDQGCAVAYHNLGALSIDLRRWAEADRYLRLCLHTVQRTGDLHLRGLALLNHAEALIALDRGREAGLAADAAVGIFDEMHAPRELADACRVLGAVLRHTGELGRAQAKLQLAVEVAANAGSELGEAEAMRELALTLASLDRREAAVALMSRAAIELDRLKPAPAASRVLAGEYPASVRAWGELLAAGDRTAAAHAERVADGAVRLARHLGYDDDGQARVRVGGYLHDLDPDCLGGAALPWDVRPILRCHRERRDGSGRPRGLRGEEIPLDAEIVGIVDAHDGTVTTADETRWRPVVVTAFRRARAA